MTALARALLIALIVAVALLAGLALHPLWFLILLLILIVVFYH